MLRRVVWAVVMATGLVFICSAGMHSAHADVIWLDQRPLPNWNSAGADVPIALPPPDRAPAAHPECVALGLGRPAETSEDQQVAAAGWQLSGYYVSGWDMKVIFAGTGYTGMCAPAGSQGFVFVDGLFAGTVAPFPTWYAADGAIGLTVISSSDTLHVLYGRRLTGDPFCLSGISFATFTVDRSGAAPVLVITDVYTPPIRAGN